MRKTGPVRIPRIEKVDDEKERRMVNVRYSWGYGSADDVLVRKVCRLWLLHTT
jgi:hypothetical protein